MLNLISQELNLIRGSKCAINLIIGLTHMKNRENFLISIRWLLNAKKKKVA